MQIEIREKVMRLPDLWKKIEDRILEFRKKDTEEIITILLEEPWYTVILQRFKEDKVLNVYTDNIVSFDEHWNGILVRVKVIGGSRWPTEKLKPFKGQNAI